MPCAIPKFKREVIKVKIELKQHDKTIAKDTSVSERIIYAYKKNMRDHGILCSLKTVLQGRSRKITPEMQEVRVNIYQCLLSKADH
jgi:transposase